MRRIFLLFMALAWVQFVPFAHAQGVASLTCNPSVIGGGSGGSTTCSVTLGSAAPTGGVAVALVSSNVELAASLPSVTVPAGQTAASFSLFTNARYRSYSLLAFTATVTASANATSQSATLNVTAQARPADFTNPNTAADASPWQGLICGRSPILQGRGSPEILYSCSLGSGGAFGTCTFRQECNFGCNVGPASNFTRQDFCPTVGPNPVAVARNYIVSGDRVPATLVTEAPVGTELTQGLPGAISNQGKPGAINGINLDASAFPNDGGITIPQGASSAPFEVATSYVPVTTFVDVLGGWSNNSAGRSGHAWIAMLPPNPPPALPIPTLGNFKITGSNPVPGGQFSSAQIDVSGVSSGGGPTITLTSSHPAVASVPASVQMPASTLLGQQVLITTQVPAVDTNVTITATDGRYTFSTILTVRAGTPPPVLSAVSVNPTTIVGGNAATGTVTLSAAQSSPMVVQVSIIETAPASLPANNPPCPSISRCYNVTVPAGSTSANFAIATTPVSLQFNLNISATLAGTERQALLLITPGAASAVTLSALTLNPASVVGGSSSTATVSLSAAAPSGGVVVSLTDNSAAATVPSSVTVPAGASSANFTVTTETVPATNLVTISASASGSGAVSGVLTVNPAAATTPTLSTLSLNPTSVVGGNSSTGTVTLSAAAPSGGVLVSLSDASAAVSVPASVTVAAGATSTNFTLTTSSVTASTLVSITASLGGVSRSATLTVNPASTTAASLSSVTVSPTSVAGGRSSTGTVTLTAAAPSGGAVVTLADNSTAASVPTSVTVPAGSTSANFTVTTIAVSASVSVTLTASYNGSSRTATLTVTAATLNSLTLNPTGVTGGTASTGTVRLTSAAPPGGALVSLSSSVGAATVPATVTVAAGATRADFTVSTTAVAAPTSATIMANYNGLSRAAVLTLNPPGVNVTLTVSATGRSGQQVTSSPAGISVAVGSTGSAGFTSNTSITLSASNGRDAVWSGACSSGGNRARNCTFTITGNASVTGNIQ